GIRHEQTGEPWQHPNRYQHLSVKPPVLIDPHDPGASKQTTLWWTGWYVFLGGLLGWFFGSGLVLRSFFVLRNLFIHFFCSRLVFSRFPACLLNDFKRHGAGLNFLRSSSRKLIAGKLVVSQIPDRNCFWLRHFANGQT